ncbi:MAG: alpha-amylase [Lachnospiraceae bacterium]|nr:alpha-amylase [Lachnospiraceae bacterium]
MSKSNQAKILDHSDTIRISAENPGNAALKLQLISLNDGSKKDIPFDPASTVGSVCSMELKDVDIDNTAYRFVSGENTFVDPYAMKISGDEKWGHFQPVGRFTDGDNGNKPAKCKSRRFSDIILYHLHVRGFTKHKSSGVINRGTFEGIVEKIPYLRKLGINAVELMPPYDFNEIIETKEPVDQEEALKPSSANNKSGKRLNYWGFTEGNYFVPKNSFSAKGDGIASFKDMVDKLHKEDIEVLVDLYFEPNLIPRYVTDVMRHWVLEYGVDGFGLFGAEIPAKDILRDPYLTETKLIFESVVDPDAINYIDEKRRDRVSILNYDFLFDNRRFLKSDADMSSRFAKHLLEEPERYGLINFMAAFNTMTMNDMVSFDRKHNEDNGEDNTDGTDSNYSWNCGMEGKSRRKAVISLRDRQIKNAFTYLLLSRGTPRIFMGDEFRNSQKGNNNPYCLDNTVTWLDWGDLDKYSGTFEFVSKLISVRKANPIFRYSLNEKEGRFPETSFHGEMAWKALFYDYFRHIGVMYSGKALYYCAFNMHWQEERLALPKPDKKGDWIVVMNTNEDKTKPVIENGILNCPARSVIILKAG